MGACATTSQNLDRMAQLNYFSKSFILNSLLTVDTNVAKQSLRVDGEFIQCGGLAEVNHKRQLLPVLFFSFP